MTPDIQELRRLAENAQKSAMDMALFQANASPSTILALIEVVEAAKGILAHAGIADADPSDVDEEDQALERRLRTALEGVKK